MDQRENDPQAGNALGPLALSLHISTTTKQEVAMSKMSLERKEKTDGGVRLYVTAFHVNNNLNYMY